MKIASIGITAEDRQAIAGELSKVLADEFVLYSKTLNYHWNIEGPDFHSVHVYLETLYNDQQEIIDNVAEKIRMIGFNVPASLKNYSELSQLSEKAISKNDSQSIFLELLHDHETIIKHLREEIKPIADNYNAAGISDYITGLMEQHEKTAWMLRSHLK